MSNIPCNYCHHKDDTEENGCNIYYHKFKCEKYSAYLDGREDAIADYDKWLATYNVSTDYYNHRIMVDRGGIKRYASDLYLEQLKENGNGC